MIFALNPENNWIEGMRKEAGKSAFLPVFEKKE